MTAAVARGAMMGYVGSRWLQGGWGWRNRNCPARRQEGDQYHFDCVTTVSRDAARDDVMSTGFIPIDFQNADGKLSPITISIYKIEGDAAEFKTETMCPPSDWDGNSASWNPQGDQPDLWVTLTNMTELEEPLEGDWTHHGDASEADRPTSGLFYCLAMCLSLSYGRRC